jgi:small subunit ribosomal protein S20
VIILAEKWKRSYHTALFQIRRTRIGIGMANIASARKAARQSIKRRHHNASLRSEIRSALKRVRKAIAGGDKNAAQQTFHQSAKVIDSIADKNIIHKNAAARYKSRLVAAIKAMGAMRA